MDEIKIIEAVELLRKKKGIDKIETYGSKGFYHYINILFMSRNITEIQVAFEKAKRVMQRLDLQPDRSWGIEEEYTSSGVKYQAQQIYRYTIDKEKYND